MTLPLSHSVFASIEQKLSQTTQYICDFEVSFLPIPSPVQISGDGGNEGNGVLLHATVQGSLILGLYPPRYF